MKRHWTLELGDGWRFVGVLDYPTPGEGYLKLEQGGERVATIMGPQLKQLHHWLERLYPAPVIKVDSVNHEVTP